MNEPAEPAQKFSVKSRALAFDIIWDAIHRGMRENPTGHMWYKLWNCPKVDEALKSVSKTLDQVKHG